MIAHDQHPARHVEGRQLALPGPQKHGVPAADIRVARGTDGLWYAAWGWFYGNGGGASPITHCPGFASEREAIEDRAELILAKARATLAAPEHQHAASDRAWAAKIERWALDQLAPQQMGLEL